ncbi:MAG: outer membrane beta-barrel protein [Candidatus Eisenbacteria bacterium]
MIRRFPRSATEALRNGAFIPALFFALAFTAAPAFAGGIQGLSYSLAPGVDHMQWNKDIDLQDDFLYGGRLGINFGRYVALRGFYFGNTDIEIEAPEGVDASTLGNVDVANYGADLALQFPRGTVLPFIYGGGGIYRFDPDEGDRFKKIGLKAGAGLRFAVSERVEAVFYAEDALIRPGSSFVPEKEGDTNDLEHNFVIGGGLNFFLGGYSGETAADRELRNKFSGGITGASWKFEPFAGRLDYDSGVNLDNTELVGVRTGIGFGPFVDLRGYYWRGTESDFGKTEQIQSYGFETQFNLNPSPGVEPHLLLGVGNLDFMGGFKDPDSLRHDDEMVLIAGGGISFTLADRWRVNVDARDYIFGPSNLEDTDNPDELFHNWMYTAGMTFTFGGGEGAPKTADVEPYPATVSAAKVKTVAAPEKAVVETVVVEKEVVKEPAEWMASPVRTYQGDRVVTIPVPTVGEIYVRYGEPGAVTIETKTDTEAAPMKAAPGTTAPAPSGDISRTEEDAMRKAIRAVLRDEMTAAHDSMRAAESVGMDDENLSVLEERLMKKIDGRVEKRVQEEIANRPATVTTSSPPVVVVSESASPAGAGGNGLVFHGGQIYTGANVDKPDQWILGGRLPLKREGGTWPIYYVPEVAFGFFNGTSTLIGANLVWDLGEHIDVQGIQPYVSAGAGILFFNKKAEGRDKQEGVLNLGYGFTKDFGKYNAFVEHQGIDIYSLHRVIVGVGWGM